jgi:hypothetical protein
MKPIIFHLLPEDVPELDIRFLEFYAKFSWYAGPAAFVLSYTRNKSLKWAIIHSFFSAPYLAYRAYEASTEDYP